MNSSRVLGAIVLLLASSTVTSLHAQGTSAPAGYTLVWADEFNEDGRPDPRNWTNEHGFVRNQEQQWYQADNAVVKGGLLVIEARREARPNPQFEAGSTDWRRNRAMSEYTSSSISTRGRHSFQYGRFEMRARIDIRSGMWPAFWTLGDAGRWPATGEIDIMAILPRRHSPRATRSTTCGSFREPSRARLASLGSSFPRTRESMFLGQMDSRFRGND